MISYVGRRVNLFERYCVAASPFFSNFRADFCKDPQKKRQPTIKSFSFWLEIFLCLVVKIGIRLYFRYTTRNLELFGFCKHEP